MVNATRERFEAKVIRGADCWMWAAAHFKATGYALFSVKGSDGKWRPTVAHRVAYELFVGPIPDGLHLDHLCRNRGCVNPAHLEPVTQRENLARGMSPAAVAVRENKCTRGHEFTPENTITRPNRPGKRECRECVRARDRKRNTSDHRRAHYRAMYWKRMNSASA